MKRLIYRDLLIWKEAEKRKPLLLRGVRQCGKTWILRKFGKENFPDTAYFTFENNRLLYRCFEQDMDPERICKELGILRGKTITPGVTFVIFDEVQFCPNALTSLKYFYEEMPQLHIACAGSLLGVYLSKSSSSFPVGKVDFLTMRPMNFEEYILACGERGMHTAVKELSDNEKIPEIIAGRLENIYIDYLITGGMPEVVQSWTTEQNLEEVERIQRSILESYESDFLKYTPKDLLSKLTLIWKSIPAQLAKDNHKFILSHVKKGLKSRDLEDALYWLVSAGIVHKVDRIEKPGVPLSIYSDNTNFKIYMTDVGLLRTLSNFPASGLLSATPVVSDMRGAMAENFVLTELLSGDNRNPYFWKSSGNAEIDFIFQDGLNIIPVEVKSGKNTRSKSLSEYGKRFHPEISLRTSLKNISVSESNGERIFDIPLYLLWNLNQYLRPGHPENE